MSEKDFSREERENLHKWGKARRLIDENKVKSKMEAEDRYTFQVKGDSNYYDVGIDIDTGKTFCPCPFKGETCAHQIACHLKLADIGVENPYYTTN